MPNAENLVADRPAHDRMGASPPCCPGRHGAADGVDLDRGQLWPCFVDGHVHLDKTQTWPRQPNPDGTHAGAKNAVIADRARHYSEADIEPRFDFGLRCAWRTAPPLSAPTWTATGRMPVRTGRCSAGCATRGPAASTCRLCRSVRWSGSPAMTAWRLADEVADSGGILGMTTTGEGGQATSPAFPGSLLDRFFAPGRGSGLADGPAPG